MYRTTCITNHEEAFNYLIKHRNDKPTTCLSSGLCKSEHDLRTTLNKADRFVKYQFTDPHTTRNILQHHTQCNKHILSFTYTIESRSKNDLEGMVAGINQMSDHFFEIFTDYLLSQKEFKLLHSLSIAENMPEKNSSHIDDSATNVLLEMVPFYWQKKASDEEILTHKEAFIDFSVGYGQINVLKILAREKQYEELKRYASSTLPLADINRRYSFIILHNIIDRLAIELYEKENPNYCFEAIDTLLTVLNQKDKKYFKEHCKSIENSAKLNRFVHNIGTNLIHLFK